ncbi:hypothetical protein RB195_001394 [Necator americanus]|uniref:Large ribosomal subunit protein mL42 n=1 Tax=Necator americanus TaxID=51031 RepID=A0ABR1DF07_NECAM
MLAAPLSVLIRRRASSSDSAKKIVVLANGAVAAWHPETKFPYEFSRPLPDKESVEKTLLSSAAKQHNRWKDGPNIPQLKDIFYTTKHEWYTRTREERLRSVAAPVPRRK